MSQSLYQHDYSLDKYINQLKSYGIQINQKLHPSIFHLKNGLQYPGLIVDRAINGWEELVKVPIELILSSFKAMRQSQLQQIFQNRFYKEGLRWQDNRVLVTYLLYIMSVNKQSIWTHMANNFSKNIDIVSFWGQEELSQFIDKSVLKAAIKERQYFQKEWVEFEQMKQLYPTINHGSWFNKQNYKWIYIHTVSRCFGSYLSSTYFVPYCQLFNHNIVDVSYKCFTQTEEEDKKVTISKDISENESDPPTQGQTNQQPSVAEDQQQNTPSISSGDSEDYLSDDDFDYMSIDSRTIKWLSKICYDLKDKEVQAIDKQLKDIYSWMDKQLQWKGFSLIYIGQMIQKLKILQNEYKAGRKKFQETLQRILQTKNHMVAFRKYLIEFYVSQKKQFKKTKQEHGVDLNNIKNTSFDNNKQQQQKQKYTHFKMEARQFAHFQPYQQIYFSYGKLSNRLLLMRYGFCLQDNPYEHYWLKYSMRKNIEPYPDLFEQIQSKALAINYKMKLKNYVFSYQILLLMRMEKWKLTHHSLQDIFFITNLASEMDHLLKIRQIYGQHLKSYINIVEDLQNAKRGYHQYFIQLYNIEKKKILQFQMELVDYLLRQFEGLEKKKQRQFRAQLKYRGPLKYYLLGLRGLISKC